MSSSPVRNVFGVHSVGFSIAAADVAGLANLRLVKSSQLALESLRFWSALVKAPSNNASRGVEVSPFL